MDENEIKYFIEAALLAAGRPLTVDQLKGLFDGRSAPDNGQIRQALKQLRDDYEERGITVSEVASGFRIQVKQSMSGRLQKLWEERSPRYSRALFETLALIAYRQPMTRGEIEEIRGVAVSTNITRSLLEREWIRVVGHRDVPGRPAMFGTTKLFLDYFGLKKLDDLPPLADLSDWESLRVQLNLPAVEDDGDSSSGDDGNTLPAAPIEGADETGEAGDPGGDDEPGAGEEAAERPDDAEQAVASESPEQAADIDEESSPASVTELQATAGAEAESVEVPAASVAAADETTAADSSPDEVTAANEAAPDPEPVVELAETADDSANAPAIVPHSDDAAGDDEDAAADAEDVGSDTWSGAGVSTAILQDELAGTDDDAAEDGEAADASAGRA